MAPFDPYHIWLGIPPQEQPAHHYRLLGITDFESDRDVISTAAERQTVFLRILQTGEHEVLVAQLLNEVSQARVTLLNSDQKAEYDEELREQQTPEPAPTPEVQTPAPTPVVVRGTVTPEFPVSVVQPAKRPRRRKPKEIWKRPAVIGIAVVGAIGVCVLLFNYRPLITNTIGMKFKLIPAGTFTMGSPEGEEGQSDNETQHPVTITKAFYMQTTEVTQGQWKEVMGTEPWKGKQFVKEGPNYAATYVSWNDAVAYCKKLSEREGKTYRLPTEAEWEYACRAGTQTAWSFGDDKNKLGDYAWYRENAYGIGEKYPHQVGLKKSNAFGLYDMHGNVWEWCHDHFELDYYKQSPEKDPQGPAQGAFHVIRSGSWGDVVTSSSRSAGRNKSDADSRNNTNVGFRVVRELDDPEQSTPPPEHLNQPFALLEFPGNPKMASIAVGTPIHSNRDYVWAKVPLELVGLQATLWEGHQGRADVNIISPGWVVMATSTRWGGGGGGGDWEQELTTKQQLLDDGWVKITTVEQKTDDPNDPLSWSVFTKEYQGGEQIRLRTEKYLAPVFFFPPRR